MSSSSKPKKLFKVASEFDVATQSIVDTLSDNGYDVTNRPNSSITQEMYDVLEGVYGDDKEKSIEHERAREEYESRRNQIMSSRNASVTIDSHLEPIDDLPLEPEEDEINTKKSVSENKNKKPIQIFLCHASEDKEKVKETYSRLKKEGFKPWLDKEDLLPGQNWRYEIRKNIRGSSFALVFLSKKLVLKRGYAQKEIKLALEILDEMPESKIFVIPIRLDECKIPQQLSSIHCVDYFKPGAIEQVITSIRVHS